jgi:uncharacterized protein
VKSVLAAVFAVLAFALASASAEVPVPPLKARVTDLSGTLSAPQVQALETSLAEFEQRKGSQIVVLMVPTTRPETIEQYSIRVAEAWKVGRKGIADGVIVLVAKNDRDVRIEVGRGLEGAIPDVLASRIEREIIVPRFQAGDFYGGLNEATRALMKLIEGEPLPAPRPPAARLGEGYQGVFVVLLMVAVIGGGILSRLLGRGGGAIGTGGLVGLVAWAITGTLVVAVIAGMIGFLFAAFAGAAGGVRHRGGWGGWGPGGGWGGGWGGGGWGGGGGFGGGGGDFGGGGASARW